MGWGGWKKIGSGIRGAVTDPRKALNAATQSGLVPGLGLAGMLASPVAYLGGLQQGGFKGGSNAMDAMNSDPGAFWSDPANRSMMAMTAAEIAAIAITAGAATAPLAGGGMTAAEMGSLYAAQGMTAPSAGLMTGTTAIGAGVGGGAAAGIQAQSAIRKQDTANAEVPPDLMDMYKNDPEQAKQFMRLRKSAAMLGRAGTIKAKGSSSLGGDQPLGTNLALTGA